MCDALKNFTILFVILCMTTAISACGKRKADAQPSVNANTSTAMSNELAETQKAAELGDVKAQFNLGYAYATGKGVPQNVEQSVVWCRKAAEQGYPPAQHLLALAYYHGTGVPRDEQEALAWFRKAADQGIADAQLQLGVAYVSGRGVSKNYEQAAVWHRKAAEQGHPLAQYNLALAYSRGQGVQKDLVQSYKWFSIASAAKGTGAENKRVEIESQMTEEQIQQAKNLAQVWKPTRIK